MLKVETLGVVWYYSKIRFFLKGFSTLSPYLVVGEFRENRGEERKECVKIWSNQVTKIQVCSIIIVRYDL